MSVERKAQSPHSSSEIREQHRCVADKWLAEHGDGSLYVTKALGAGGFSSCWLLWSASAEQDNSFVALKIIDRGSISKTKRDCVKREISIHKSLSHPNIVDFYRYTIHQEFVFIFMEYCRGGSLAQRIRKCPLEETELVSATQQLLSALDYLHSQSILHRDVKPGNVLIAETEPILVKLADFGLSIRLNPNDPPKVSCGTPYYFSPEMVNGHSYGFPADIWSFGILLYAASTGKVPFFEENIDRQEILKRISCQPIRYPKSMSRPLVSFLSKILCREPSARVSLGELRKHKWIN